MSTATAPTPGMPEVPEVEELPQDIAPADRRSPVRAGLLVAVGVLAVFVFGVGTASGKKTVFVLMNANSKLHVGNLTLPSREWALAMGALCVVIGLVRLAVPVMHRPLRLTLSTVYGIAFVLSFLCWAVAGKTLNIVDLLSGTMLLATPLVLGSLSGVLCERSGVINVAIEGQFLVSAFLGALVGSDTGNRWVGLICAALGGALMGALLAVFAIRYFVNQVILGVVLNVFAMGLTGFLYDRVLQPNSNTLNSPPIFQPVKVPGLGDIPIVGPVLFNTTAIVYMMYVLLVVVHVALFHTRWGLRTRAVGEHPVAADTLGVKVNATRYRNVILGGLIAGVGGAYFTLGSVGSFTKNMTAGKGFIALAALIFGRWSPFGALAAALLFGFADQLQSLLSIIGTPIPSEFLLMAPYLATIFAVAGLVGRVRAPAADGEPYTKG